MFLLFSFPLRCTCISFACSCFCMHGQSRKILFPSCCKVACLKHSILSGHLHVFFSIPVLIQFCAKLVCRVMLCWLLLLDYYQLVFFRYCHFGLSHAQGIKKSAAATFCPLFGRYWKYNIFTLDKTIQLNY